jgi:transcriptional regulator of acetoin/glycerol metabolism
VLLKRLEPDLGHKVLSTSALAMLVAHAWPGNIRELSSVLYRAAALASGPEILAQHLSLRATEVGPRRALPRPNVDVQALLASHAGNVSAAARAAGVPRTTFRALLLRNELEASGRRVGSSQT